MSRQIHIPNLKSISQSTTEKSSENQVDGHWVDWRTDWQRDGRTDGQTDWLTDSEETYSPPHQLWISSFLFLPCNDLNIGAAFLGMHVSPSNHSYAWLPRKCDYRTDTQRDRRRTKWSLCVAMFHRRHKKSSPILNVPTFQFHWIILRHLCMITCDRVPGIL